ncbi:Lrp/AsnC family transcriptional regulator [Methylomicrobium sp. RS1]|jgi:DNA-binding Lrp family transcriptional regulator|uniref:Lrp/AsnC family transcriptional regulator n=1 Tax=Candidatus Methylomicrobium oryzae TaxID=2802053 RepID=UPI001924A5E3|nr:AsnC family transcriptional regulator [Methylomicrobium sp. RS1]MBL1265452.1 AsnC family transcriptional regulator [Methylomicrobium sp. RS1]
MDEIDRRIINALQAGFPISERPYLEAAQALGLSEQELLERLGKLLQEQTLSRFGPLYDAEAMGGALTLAAMQVPEERFEEVAEIVNGFQEVAHNYARRHTLNMWFVLATETPQQLRDALDEIERRTGLTVYDMPKITEYFVGLKLEA